MILHKLVSLFNRSHISMLASQVTQISPDLSGRFGLLQSPITDNHCISRWTKERRFKLVWEVIQQLKPSSKFLTHKYSIDDAAQAYKLLDENPRDTIQVALTYPKEF